MLNLVVKALLFGHKSEAFEAEVDGGPGLDAARHEIWRKKGPIGKLHNLVHWIHQSDKKHFSSNASIYLGGKLIWQLRRIDEISRFM